MTSRDRKFRLLTQTVVSLAAVWAVTVVIFHFSARTKMTADKVDQFVVAKDLSQLSGTDRDQAITDLAAMVNALSPEERMKWRLEDGWKKWFSEMTEAEKLKFIEATLPTGFQQMLSSFSQLPEDKRQKMIGQAEQQLQADGAVGMDKSIGSNYGKDGAPQLSPELEQKVREIGLNEVFQNSSAETKAELAPLLEQMQIQIRQGGH